MEVTIFVTLVLSLSATVIAAEQMVVLNFTKQHQVNVINSTLSEHEDVTICARFLVEPSKQNSEIFTYGPISLKSNFYPNQAFDQILGEVYYRTPMLRNSPNKTFPVWPPGVWNHVCVSFAGKNCGVRVFLNGQTVVDSIKMDPCFGLHRSGFLLRLDTNMVGLLTDLNIWDQVISIEAAKVWTKCETMKEGNLVAWRTFATKINNYVQVNKDVWDRNYICRKPGHIVGYTETYGMYFDMNLNFCRLLGGKMPTLGDNKTMERINDTLIANPNFSAKWAFTGYVLDEKEEPVNTYTGYLVCHKINKIPRNSGKLVAFFWTSETTFCAFDGIKYKMIMVVDMIIDNDCDGGNFDGNDDNKKKQ